MLSIPNEALLTAEMSKGLVLIPCPVQSHSTGAKFNLGFSSLLPVLPLKISQSLTQGTLALIFLHPMAKQVINPQSNWFAFPGRHSSYGRLLDDHDYGSWGNYNNPLYDDS